MSASRTEVPSFNIAATDFINQVAQQVRRPGQNSRVQEYRFGDQLIGPASLVTVWAVAPRSVHLFVIPRIANPGEKAPTIALTVEEAFGGKPASASFRKSNFPGLPDQRIKDLAALAAGRPYLDHLR